MNQSRSASIALLFALIFVYGPAIGCISPARMQPVAAAGFTASQLAHQATRSLRSDLATFREERYLAAAMGSGDTSEQIEGLASRVKQVRVLMRSREELFTHHGQLYGSLKRLAEYDGYAELNGVAGDAAAAVARHAGLTQVDAIKRLVDTTAANLLQAIQQRSLAKVNIGLAQFNEAIVDLLKEERDRHTALHQVLYGAKQKLVIGLIEKEYAWPHLLIEQYAAEVGLAYDPKQFIQTYRQQKQQNSQLFRQLRSLLIEAHLARFERQHQAQKDVLDAAIEAFQALAASHRRLERDASELDITELTLVVRQLRLVAVDAAQIAEEVRLARASARAIQDEQRDERQAHILRLVAQSLGISFPEAGN